MHTIHLIATCAYVVIGILSMFAALDNTTVVAEQRPGDCSGICDLAWSPVEENILGVVDEFGLWLYDTNETDAQFFPHENATSLSFDPTGQYVAVTSCADWTNPTDPCNGSISLFDIQEQSWTELRRFNYSIGNVKFSPDGRYVTFENDEIGAWGIQMIDLTTNDTFTIGDQRLTNLIIEYAFDPQSNTIAISNGDIGTEGHVFWGLSVWKLSDQTLQGFTDESLLAADLTFTETDTTIMFVEYNTEISLWNYSTGVISSINKMNETVGDYLHQLSFSNPPTFLLAALLDDWHPGDRMLFAWNVQSGEQVFFRDMPEGSFTDLIVINPTGEYIAYSSTVDERKIVRVWERTTGSTRQARISE
jgi:WD40 repeat protein